MKLFTRIILFSAISLCTAGCIEHEPESPLLPTESWDMPIGISSAESFVWHDTLFVLFGREGQSAASPQPYGYAISLDDPTIVRQFPLPVPPRVKAAGVLIGDRYYCGLGFSGYVYHDGANLTDWYCWDMNTREITRLTDMLSIDTNDAVAWHTADSIFISMCYNTSFSRATYRYDINADRWEMLNHLSVPSMRASAAGAMVAGRMFAGGGFSTFMENDWYEFNPDGYRWETRAKMPTKGRMFAAATASDRTIFLIGGRFFGGTHTTEHFYRSILAYDVAHDRWTVLGDMPIGAEHQIAAWHDGYLYWGLGQDGDKNMIRTLYRYRP